DLTAKIDGVARNNGLTEVVVDCLIGIGVPRVERPDAGMPTDLNAIHRPPPQAALSPRTPAPSLPRARNRSCCRQLGDARTVATAQKAETSGDARRNLSSRDLAREQIASFSPRHRRHRP